METTAMLENILTHIDAHLGEALSPSLLACRAGYSVWHFCRMFRYATGYGVMEYVRLRRLAFAAHALAKGGRILDISLDYGFETHAGFTKAFRRRYGCPPEVYRLHAQSPCPAPPNLAFCTQYAIGGIIMEPKFVKLPAIRLAGYKLRTGDSGVGNNKAIPAFWDAYLTDGRCEKLHQEGFVVEHAEYGACFMPDPETGAFDYMIGVRVAQDAQIPSGYEVCTLPAAAYAVFSTPPCREEEFAASIQGLWRYAFEEWFPNSGYEYAQGCADFEVYDERCMGDEGKVCDVYIPVARKAMDN